MFAANKFTFLPMFIVLGLFTLPAAAQLADKKVVDLNGAKTIAAAGEAEAKQLKLNVVIAVVDDGGHLIYLQRADGTPTGSVDVAIGKARTAAAFKRPTKVLDDMTTTRPAIATLPNTVLVEGGVPIMVGQQVAGAVGVSGASSQQDAQIAEAGISALKK